MADTFLLEIVTPETRFYAGSGGDDHFQYQRRRNGCHAAPCGFGCCHRSRSSRIRRHGEWSEVFISNGFIEIFQAPHICWVQTAEWPDEIDRRRAEDA